MISNIAKIAVRILFRNKVFSLINISGLSIGLACSILIFSIVKNELSYDRFHEKADQLFCLRQTMDLGAGTYTADRTGGACGPALAEAFPEISAFVRHSMQLELLLTCYPGDSTSVKTGERKTFIEESGLAADSNFFSLFTFHPVAGNLERALDDPYSIVMTRSLAEKYFGKADPLDQVINVNRKYEFTVSAVVENVPENSSIRFDFVVNFGFLEELGRNINQYDGNPYVTFLCFDDPSLASGMDSTLTKYLNQFNSEEFLPDYGLLSLKDYHNKGEVHGGFVILLFTILASIILVIACINFMNLSTARYLKRTREVGIRKAVGAGRSRLIRQFIGETMIVTFFALNLAILLIDFLLPYFNRSFEVEATFSLKDPWILGGLIIIFIVTSLVAGSYPAFFLSSFNPVNVLGKSKISNSRGGGIRKVLVVVQFFFAALFISAALVNFRQTRLLDERRNEIDNRDVIYIPVRGDLNRHYEEFKQELLQNPGIESVSSASMFPTYVESGDLEWGRTAEETNDIAMILPVGYDFDKTFNIQMEEGRFYSYEYQADSINSVIVNRKVADALGFEEPLGQTIYLSDNPYTIIGVIRDYSFYPLSVMGGKAIITFRKRNSMVFIKLNDSNVESAISHIKQTHEKFNPGYPFDHFLLEEHIDMITQIMLVFKRIIYFFTFFGIFISCLGLLGLSMFLTEQRTKEIGIRKAVGASGYSILRLVTLDFLKLVLISLLISVPVSVLVLRLMLNLFADRISLGPGLFLVTAIILILVAMVTVSIQAMRSARSNPADSLRYE